MTDFRVAQTLTISNGGTTSPALDLIETRSKVVVGLFIAAPATLPETVTVQATASLASPNWVNLQSGGTDVTIAQGKGTQITETSAAAIRLIAGGAVGADRVFNVIGASRA